ncbi:MarR family transcriptional regulator [Ferrimonas sediminicola]|uniref:MarR family transcriptional regulator n=1 Tax=Ferrimonas sediminicola TaxID=2569538 RepID=A0A4U1BFJ0_9GAMM|nr:MarR family transcriptional regulator [Ferrimonas sediminicola]TKB49693.1 MarR family transcriptional regulator [Ferrimonas sediminicola]
MPSDHVDRLLEQWKKERADLDCSPIGVVGRISRCCRLMELDLIKVFKNHNIDSIEFDILASIRRSCGPMTPTELYRTLMLSSGAMSTRLEKLVQKGFVTRTSSDSDRRSCVVSLTPEGKALIDKAFTDHVANEDRLLSPLSSDERQQLASLLRRWLAENEKKQ